MSNKIPEAEWTTVAARRSSGESVAAIARDYGCSPALVYAVLKKAPAPRQEQRMLAPAVAEGPEPSIPVSTGEQQDGPLARLEVLRSATVNAEVPSSASATRGREAGAEAVSPQQPRPSSAPLAGAATAATSPRSAKPIALTANLDDALWKDAEATFSRFRDAFTTALGTNDAAKLEALRQASSELMRVGARTSIVVERLGNAVDRPASGSRKTERQAANNAELEQDALSGTVKWFNPEKGFGFVAVDGVGDVYVNVRALHDSGLETLQEGQRVRLTTRQSPRGPQAARVEALRHENA